MRSTTHSSFFFFILALALLQGSLAYGYTVIGPVTAYLLLMRQPCHAMPPASLMKSSA